MIGRILRIAFFIVLAGLVAHRLFSRRQKRALHETAQIGAWVLLAAAALALCWHLLAGSGF